MSSLSEQLECFQVEIFLCITTGGVCPDDLWLATVCMDGFLSVPSLANHNWGAGYTIALSFRVPRFLPRRSVLLANGPAPHATFWVELVPEFSHEAQAGTAPAMRLVIGGSTHRLRGAAPPDVLTTSRTAPWIIHGNTTRDSWMFLALTFDPRDGGAVRVVTGDGECVLGSSNLRFPEGLDRVGVPLGTPLVLGAATEDGLHSFCGAVHELQVRAFGSVGCQGSPGSWLPWLRLATRADSPKCNNFKVPSESCQTVPVPSDFLVLSCSLAGLW